MFYYVIGIIRNNPNLIIKQVLTEKWFKFFLRY